MSTDRLHSALNFMVQTSTPTFEQAAEKAYAELRRQGYIVHRGEPGTADYDSVTVIPPPARTDFIEKYLEAALWADANNSEGEALPDLNIYTSFDPATRALMETDCDSFLAQCGPLDDLCTHQSDDITSVYKRAGHDFWLTRQHHGSGFWDGDWKEPHGDRLTKLAQTFKEQTLYQGDDDLIYIL